MPVIGVLGGGDADGGVHETEDRVAVRGVLGGEERRRTPVPHARLPCGPRDTTAEA